MSSRIRNLAKRIVLTGARVIGFKQSEGRIAEDAQRYWANPDARGFRNNSHWRGTDGLSDDVWLELGRIHMGIFDEFIKLTALTKPLERTVEWGCGGGSNAVHFAKATRQFVGVDLSQASLDECGKNIREAGQNNFVPVLIDVANPEGAIKLIPGPCDLFLCIYVFELIPTPEYGRRLLEIAHQILRPGGIALIQIKYETNDPRTRSRRWGYRVDLANMTTYTIEAFWEMAGGVGFKPLALTLQPKQPLVHEERYAYFILERPPLQAAPVR